MVPSAWYTARSMQLCGSAYTLPRKSASVASRRRCTCNVQNIASTSNTLNTKKKNYRYDRRRLLVSCTSQTSERFWCRGLLGTYLALDRLPIPDFPFPTSIPFWQCPVLAVLLTLLLTGAIGASAPFRQLVSACLAKVYCSILLLCNVTFHLFSCCGNTSYQVWCTWYAVHVFSHDLLRSFILLIVLDNDTFSLHSQYRNDATTM